jgi:hypothetical protein
MNNNNLKIMVNRLELIKTIEANRDKFKEDYDLAKKGFKIELRKELEKKLKALDDGKKVDLSFKNRKPESHLGDYLEILEMLEMSTSVEVELDQKSFKQYVKNEWDWAKFWSLSNSSYLLSAGGNN